MKDVYDVLFGTTKNPTLDSLEQTNLKIMLCIDLVFYKSEALTSVLIKAAMTEIDIRTGKIRTDICFGLITGALYERFSDFTFKKLAGGRRC